jgi:N-acetyl sugar amidotransferase
MNFSAKTISTTICSRCVLDTTVPDINFDEQGICNYCRLHDVLDCAFPQGEEGKEYLLKQVADMKRKGKGKKYDCIIGVSGGTDSTYLCHLAIELGLRPLAVNFDNGWHSEIAVGNIHESIQRMNIDLETYVVNYDEMTDILRSYMKAGFPWIDCPTDIGIVSSLFKIANREGIKYIWVGNNFRSEGKQPDEWTHSDGRQLKYLQKKFGTLPLKTFPNLTIWNLVYYSLLRGIKMFRPFYHIEYSKQDAKKLIIEKYGWRDYGGHHHESIFTRFAIAYWLPRKFNIDKRKVTWAAQVRSGKMSRDEALEQLAELPYDAKRMEEDKSLVIKKLKITEEEFTEMWNTPNKTFRDYPSYFPIYERSKKVARFVFNRLLPFKPMMMFEAGDSKKN